MNSVDCIGMFTQHSHESSSKTTLEKGGKNPPDVTLDDILKDLLLFVNQFESLDSARNKIENKYSIIKDRICWAEDDIKRAWGKTQRMHEMSSKRQHWALVILLQVIKRRLYYEECKRKSVQSNAIEDKDLAQSCEESTKQSMTGSTQDRSTPSGAELSKKKKNKKSVQTETSDKESPSGADADMQTCGTEQSITGNTQDISTQSDAELNKQKKKEKNPATKPVYIRIPFSNMFDKESPSNTKIDKNIRSLYKLIDRVPEYRDPSEIRKRKSYIMSYNSDTKNANWVYEILNKSTLENKCKEQMSFGRNELENKDCNQGHLAAAANHRWCQEAYHDTFLMSNMIPQNNRLNKGMWSKLEQYCRDFVKDDSVQNVHVYSGPIYSKKEMNPSKVKAVPCDFFKVVIVENKDGTVKEPECYVMENKSPEHTELENFKVGYNTFTKRNYPFKFIEHDTKYNIKLKKMVKLTGEDGNGESHSVDIHVIIIPPNA